MLPPVILMQILMGFRLDFALIWLGLGWIRLELVWILHFRLLLLGVCLF